MGVVLGGKDCFFALCGLCDHFCALTCGYDSRHTPKTFFLCSRILLSLSFMFFLVFPYLSVRCMGYHFLQCNGFAIYTTA
jgi:hypothetical protein